MRSRFGKAHPGVLSDADFLALFGAETASSVVIRQLAWVSVAEPQQLGLAVATALGAAFELRRRGAWLPPRHGTRASRGG